MWYGFCVCFVLEVEDGSNVLESGFHSFGVYPNDVVVLSPVGLGCTLKPTDFSRYLVSPWLPQLSWCCLRQSTFDGFWASHLPCQRMPGFVKGHRNWAMVPGDWSSDSDILKPGAVYSCIYTITLYLAVGIFTVLWFSLFRASFNRIQFAITDVSVSSGSLFQPVEGSVYPHNARMSKKVRVTSKWLESVSPVAGIMSWYWSLFKIVLLFNLSISPLRACRALYNSFFSLGKFLWKTFLTYSSALIQQWCQVISVFILLCRIGPVCGTWRCWLALGRRHTPFFNSS